MDGQPQPFAAADSGARSTQPQRNSLADFRSPPPGANGHPSTSFPQGPMPVPAGPPGPNGNNFASPMHRRNGTAPHGPSHSGFAFREAPGGTKNTSHVPCKFFRLGNCQAGKACPFSHALDTINDPAPCKYFAKGNCKYGYKCANPHMLPDGRDGRKVNHGRRPYGQEAGGFNIGPPAHAGPFPEQGMQNAYPVMPPSSSSNFDPYNPPSDDHFQHQRTLDNLPTIDQAYNSHNGMQYGSPPNENRNPMSPPIRALDAQLPSSFDSNGISNMARYGPIASSVPSRFGFGPSSPTTSTATSTAFGNLGYMARGETNGSRSSRAVDLASSPPAPEHTFSKRILHSDRISQPQNIASSLPVPRPMMRMHHNAEDSEYDSDDDKVNWLPGALSDDVMTPQEKMRRFSRHEDDSGHSARGSLTLSGLGSAQDSKVGSPSNGSPSSRWGALFAQKQRQPDPSDFPSSSPYGHVGSPLRNSSLPVNPNASPTIKPIGRPPTTGTRSGDVSPFGWSSPPTSGRITMGSGIGILSQQLKNTRLRDSAGMPASSDAPPSSTLHPPGTRSISQSTSANAIAAATASSSAAGAGSAAINISRGDRAVSSSSVGRRSDRIDEEGEPEPCLFEMDEEDTRVKELMKKERERQKRWSGPGGGGVYQGGSPWNVPAAVAVAEPRISMSSSDGMSSSSPPGNASSKSGAPNAASDDTQKPIEGQRLDQS